ncbi:MAG: hypothetical protein Q8O48_02880, partial [Anaerolineales bacterium]|nr:hypothetical protein [Anaerolineales bacterium]
LTDKSVQFRNRWRSIALLAAWLLLSGFTMILHFVSVKEDIHLAIVIGLSFVKYIPLLMVVYSLSRRMAAKYLDDIYELHDKSLATDFLEDIAFGFGREHVTINEGRISEKDERSPIVLIGGPGTVQVNLDSVALLEKVNGEPEVIYPRSEAWKLGRFERIREIGKHDQVGKREYAIINLRDQFISGLSLKSRTKDGIPLEAQGIKAIFSILRRKHSDDDHDENGAYLFDERAVQALVYNQTIITPEPATPSGINFPWDTTVVPLIISELEKLITSHTLSEILASISQKEVDQVSTNAHAIAQMRVEMTGEQTRIINGKNSRPPNFESRSKITAQFFNSPFKEKAAKLGIALEWIDIGTWQLPSSLILDKHKEAWNQARENEKKRNAMARSRKQFELTEIIKLINNVVISNYDKLMASRSSINKDKEISNEGLLEELGELIQQRPEFKKHIHLDDHTTESSGLLSSRPKLENQVAQGETNKKDAHLVALEILKAFRLELVAAKMLIENESNSAGKNNNDLIKIEKALYDISQLTLHY